MKYSNSGNRFIPDPTAPGNIKAVHVGEYKEFLRRAGLSHEKAEEYPRPDLVDRVQRYIDEILNESA